MMWEDASKWSANAFHAYSVITEPQKRDLRALCMSIKKTTSSLTSLISRNHYRRELNFIDTKKKL